MVTVKAGCKDGFFGGVWYKISCELPGYKLVVRHIFVESMNHPVAPWPLASVVIILVTMRISITCYIQPWQRHPLAVSRKIEQPVHLLFICRFTVVVKTRFCFFNSCKEPGEIQ